MAYFTPEDIQQAKQLDLLTYLQIYEPDQLVKVSGDTYCTKEHDSLKISNGKWHWFSRQIGGKTALDYLVKVRGCSFLEAMEILHGAPLPKTIPAPAPKVESKKLLLPERNGNADAVVHYLKSRGIHDFFETGPIYPRYHSNCAPRRTAHFRLQQALGTNAACAKAPTYNALGTPAQKGWDFEGSPPGFHHPRLSIGCTVKSVFVIAFL